MANTKNIHASLWKGNNLPMEWPSTGGSAITTIQMEDSPQDTPNPVSIYGTDTFQEKKNKKKHGSFTLIDNDTHDLTDGV